MGEQLDFTVTIRGATGMSGENPGNKYEPNALPYLIFNDGQGGCSHTAYACPLPNGEFSTTAGPWGSGDLIMEYRGPVTPVGSSFRGRKVKEYFPFDTLDGCHFPGGHYPPLPNPIPWVGHKVTGGLVGGPSIRWGQDLVGWTDHNGSIPAYYQGVVANWDSDWDGTPDLTDSSDGYSAYDGITVGPDGVPGTGDEEVAPPVLGPTDTCSIAFWQQMRMRCENLIPQYQTYTGHFQEHTIHDDELGVSRDGVSPPNQSFP